MGISKQVVHSRVANIVGVPFDISDKKPAAVEPPQELAPQVRIPPALGRQERVLPEVKIRVTELRSDFARVEWDVARMPGLAYKVWLDGVAKGPAVTEPRKELSGLKPGRRYKVEIRTQPYSKSDRRAPSKKVTHYFTTSPAVTVVTPQPPKPPVPPVPAVTKPVRTPSPPMKTKKDQIWYFDEDTLRCKELAAGAAISAKRHKFTNRRECQAALSKHIQEARKFAAVERAKERKRKVSARVEELMKKRSFPKAVKEAIEKGLERKDAPRDIERILEKVAKTNEPDYILRSTLAKRIGRRGIVQYKVDTDKGPIIYENADETTVNAILGMPTPTGEVIPLQIKVIR